MLTPDIRPYVASSAVLPTMPLLIVQVRGAHGTDDDGAQLCSLANVPPDGVVTVAAPKTFEKT